MKSIIKIKVSFAYNCANYKTHTLLKSFLTFFLFSLSLLILTLKVDKNANCFKFLTTFNNEIDNKN